MTIEDKIALKEFLSGAGVVIGLTAVIVVLFVSLTAAANWLEAQPTPKNQRFEVVDKYDGRCNVVRYTPSNSSTYKYFLDCKK